MAGAKKPGAKKPKRPKKAKLSSNELKVALAGFLKRNSKSTIEEIGTAGEKLIFISRPWNDPSIVLNVSSTTHPLLVDTLAHVVLPERFSAIYHADTKELEVIYTAFKIESDIKDVSKRSFEISFQNKKYACEFSTSSDRLLTIAQHSVFVQASDTTFRNLSSFQDYANNPKDDRMDKPLSFWIRGVPADEDFLMNFAQHINFYMSYFDDQTPEIIIHAPTTLAETKDPTRYTTGSFPQKIAAKEIDPNILHFWSAARGGDASRSFLYYYRILEYVAVQFLDSSARSAVRKTLAQPNALDDVQATMEQVVSAIQKTKMEEYQRIEMLLRETLNVDLLWREINLNLDMFNKEITFDGGYVLAPLVSKNATLEQFAPNACEIFSKRIRDLRNALSHGRDVKTASVIPPTHKNFDLLSPWISLIATAAGQTILYNDVV